LAQERLKVSQANAATASQRLGLSERQHEARTFGTQGGTPIPGSMIDDNENVIGTANAPNVRPTAAARNAAERAGTLDSLDARIRAALKHPELTGKMGPIEGRLKEIQGKYGTLPRELAELKNDLVSYGAFQAGLHPVRGIGALQYFDKVMGGLGQNPEQLLGKMDSNLATSKSVKAVGKPKTVGSKEANAGRERTDIPANIANGIPEGESRKVNAPGGKTIMLTKRGGKIYEQ
jgi:hypothetical protein